MKCYETQAWNTKFIWIFYSTWDYFTVHEQLIAYPFNQLQNVAVGQLH